MKSLKKLESKNIQNIKPIKGGDDRGSDTSQGTSGSTSAHEIGHWL